MNGMMKILRIQRRRSVAGFTLLELLVVIVIIAVLFAIAAPSWDTLMNRQRVNVVRDQVVQIIRQGQNDARRTRTPRVVIFDNSTGVLRAAVQGLRRDPATGQISSVAIDPNTITNWTTLGSGDIRAGTLNYSFVPAQPSQLVFDPNGFVDQVSITRAGTAVAKTAETATSKVFAVTVQQRNTSAQTNRCVIVKTILGATSLAEGTQCNI